MPYEDGYFDVVTMLAVLEHIEPANVPVLIGDVRRVLKPGGVFILTTPPPWTDQLLSVMARLRLVSATEIHDHKVTYRPAEIATMLEAAGFDAGKIRTGYFELGMNIWVRAEK